MFLTLFLSERVLCARMSSTSAVLYVCVAQCVSSLFTFQEIPHKLYFSPEQGSESNVKRRRLKNA